MLGKILGNLLLNGVSQVEFNEEFSEKFLFDFLEYPLEDFWSISSETEEWTFVDFLGNHGYPRETTAKFG